MQSLPNWAGHLIHYYVVIRVDGRNLSRRRKYYRLVEKEKLRLAELGICQECIRLTCRYLAKKRLLGRLKECDLNHGQMSLF